MKKQRVYFLMFVLLTLWGSLAAVSKLTLRSMDSYQSQFYMFGSAFIAMILIGLFNGRLWKLKDLSRKDLILLVFISIPSFLYYLFYFMALRLIPAIEASMLNYLFPIMIVLFAVPINGEKLNVVKLSSVILGFAGMIIIITNGSFRSIRISNLAGDLLAVGAAVSWGIFSNLGKKIKLDIFTCNFMYTAISFLLSIISLFMFSSFIVPDLSATAGVSWNALSNIVLSYYIWFKILKVAPTTLVASLSFITPFVTLFFIMLLLGEKMTIIQVAGLGVIIAGILIQTLEGSKFIRILINSFIHAK